jgi:hypothetical protein
VELTDKIALNTESSLQSLIAAPSETPMHGIQFDSNRFKCITDIHVVESNTITDEVDKMEFTEVTNSIKKRNAEMLSLQEVHSHSNSTIRIECVIRVNQRNTKFLLDFNVVSQ